MLLVTVFPGLLGTFLISYREIFDDIYVNSLSVYHWGISIVIGIFLIYLVVWVARLYKFYLRGKGFFLNISLLSLFLTIIGYILPLILKPCSLEELNFCLPESFNFLQPIRLFLSAIIFLMIFSHSIFITIKNPPSNSRVHIDRIKKISSNIYFFQIINVFFDAANFIFIPLIEGVAAVTATIVKYAFSITKSFSLKFVEIFFNSIYIWIRFIRFVILPLIISFSIALLVLNISKDILIYIDENRE